MLDEGTTPLEEKLNTISTKLTELEDLQLVNKLDIINLKNEIEKVKLTSSAPGPDILRKIKELGKIVENAEEFKKLQYLTRNMEKIMAAGGFKPEGLEDMIRVVDDVDKRLRKLETGGLDMKPGEAEEYAKMIEELKSGFKDLPRDARGIMELSVQLKKLRMMMEENAKNILKLSKVGEAEPVRREFVKSRAPVKEDWTRIEEVPEKAVKRPAVEKPVKKPAKPIALKCPKCGAELPSHAVFCRKCGTKIRHPT